MPTLSLNDIVQVTVAVSPVSSIRSNFNMGLIVGKSTIISAVTRVKTYANLAAMVADGWSGSNVEYLAAVDYFAQSPTPTEVAIGRWDGTGAETALQAVTACRGINSDWYGCMICGAVKADILAVAPYIETAVPSSVFFYGTVDADVIGGVAGNVMITLYTALRKRTIGVYMGTINKISALLGYAMGANNSLPGSAYTLAYKTLTNVTPDVLTTAQIATVKGYKGNVYVNRGINYDLLEQGSMHDGTYFDEVLNLDIIANDIQQAIMDALNTLPKIPQTEEGVNLLMDAITIPLEAAKVRGFLAPGTWNAAQILNLIPGTTLSKGYIVIADSFANQSQADRELRKAPPIYVAIKLAGAVEHVVISVYVNR
jgi:hypothetical protein